MRTRPCLSSFGFRVTVNGTDLHVYENQRYLEVLEPGETRTLDLYNFWSSETHRPPKKNGSLKVEVAVVEARWVSKTMEDYAPRAMATLEKRFNLLVLVASVSPLFGMTGTVIGMIKSFDSLADANTTAVASGISVALLTTAAGLLVAIPAIIAYNLYSKRVDTYLLVVEQMISDVVGFISDQHS